MSNVEMLLRDIKYLEDLGVNIFVYQKINGGDSYFVEINGTRAKFTMQDLKKYLQELKNEIGTQEEEEIRKRRMFRSALLDASEQIARKYNKQVFTLSIGDFEE